MLFHNLFLSPSRISASEDNLMNRQFFGDTRDLFKYDLVRHIMKALPVFDSFTFIPMLTEDENSDKGKKSKTRDLEKAVKVGKAGSQNRDLVEHMQRLQEIDNDLEYFQTIGAYFKKENILVDILHKQQFSHNARNRYFDNILASFPKKSLVFLDPDIGLEESKPSDRHVLFDEVERICQKMDPKSVLMIYQHFPREKHEGYVHRRCSELFKRTGFSPVSITDNEIVFFFIVKNAKLAENLEEILSLYADTYPALSSCSCQ
jgi:hypothetical protein